ncbi:putative cyclin-dependent kinase 2 [Triangularia verruculosa]|uniref:Cyclin-dependent kinase 2 n=1 Tax=Triangularia verruculosa TaxID=2587418 RepID=A0AAN7ASP9_9PEZI|nr:putative cyclin-dependent kinase 2 [Triangularia verruculosa]
MEWYYRLVMGQRNDCARNEYVELLLSCALPEIDLENVSFEYIQEIWPRLFFSKKKITKKFGNAAVLDRLLQCGCGDCNTLRTGNPQVIRDAMLGSPKGAILLSALVLLLYLDRLHYIYPLISLKATDSLQSMILHLDPAIDGMRGLVIMKEEDLNLIDTPEKKLSVEDRAERKEKTRQWKRRYKTFEAMRNEVFCMFEPVTIRLNQKDFCPEHQWYLHQSRFPFLDAEDRVPQGSFGTVIKFRIPAEYLHESVKGFMESRYRGSRDEATGEYLFVRKSLKLQKGELPHKPTTGNNEGTIARLASMIAGEAANNIISLLALYTWRGSLYFMFPCLKTDLYHLLRQTTLPGDKSKLMKLRSDQGLPDHWLWEQMIGVARALSAIHTKMKLPHGGIEGYIIASHFDLKPANILVTSQGVLKVTDFGESVISVTKSLQNMSTPFRPGDPKYAAPESRPSEEELEKAYGAGEDKFQVLLNYDVWALACVMTEVLVVLLDTQVRPTEIAIDRFHADLEKESRVEETRGTFLEGRHELKPYVRGMLESFPKLPRSSGDDPQKWYLESVSNLLFRMFSVDNSKRPFSINVLEELTQADKLYRQNVKNHRDPLSWAVGQERLRHHGHSEFQEVGWDQSGSFISFLHMFATPSCVRVSMNKR